MKNVILFPMRLISAVILFFILMLSCFGVPGANFPGEVRELGLWLRTGKFSDGKGLF